MAVEDDTLKTLVRIENLLKSSNSTTSGSGSTSGGRSGGATRTPVNRTQNQNDKKQNKVFTATSKSVDDLGDAADDVSRRFGKLSKTVFATQGQFVALNKSMRVFSRRPDNQTAPRADADGGGSATNAVAAGVSRIFGARSPVTRAVSGLTSNIGLTQIALAGFASKLKDAAFQIGDDFFTLASKGINNTASSMIGLYTDAARAGLSLKEYTDILEESGPAVVRANSMADFNKTLRTTNDQLGTLGVFGPAATKLAATMANSATTLGVPQAQLGDSMKGQVSVFEQLRKTSMITADQFAKLNEQLANNESVQSELLGMEPQQRAARLTELQRTNTIGLSMGMTAEASKRLGDALIEQRKLTAVQRFKAAGSIRQAGAIAGMSASDSETLAGLSRKKNRSAEENAQFVELGGQLTANIERMQNSGNIAQENIADQIQDQLKSVGISQQLELAGQARLAKQSGPIVNKDVGQNTGEIAKSTAGILTWLEGFSKNPLGAALKGALSSAAFAATLAFGFKGALKLLPGAAGAATAAGPGLLGRGAAALGQGAKNLGARALELLGHGPELMGPPKPGMGYRAGRAVGRGVGAVGRVVSGGSELLARGAAGAGRGIGAIGKGISGAVSSGSSLIKMVPSLLGGLGNTIAEIGPVLFKQIGPMLTNVFKTGFSFLGGFLKRVPILSFFIDTVGELFTNDVAAAFSGDANWAEKIGNAIFAGISGIFGGIFSLIDTAGSFFGLSENFFRNKFDMVSAWVRGGFFALLEGLAKIVTFGSENSVSKYFQQSADNAFAVVDKLAADSTSTIGTMGAKNNAELDKQKKAAEGVTAANKVAAASVVTSTKNLTAEALSTARAVAPRTGVAAPDETAVVATPGTTPRTGVTVPDVNTAATATAAGEAAATAATQAAAGTTPATTMNTQLAAIIQILNDSLALERQQNDTLSQMLGIRPRRDLGNNDAKLNALLSGD